MAATNPKGYLFFSAFLPQFVEFRRAAGATVPDSLALVFVTIDFAVMLAYAGVGARAARVMRSSAAKWLDRICGGTLLGLAATLALYRRTTN